MEDWVFEYVGHEAQDEGIDPDDVDFAPIKVAWVKFDEDAQDALIDLLGEDGAELYLENDDDLYLLFMTITETGRSFLDGDMDHIEADLPITLKQLSTGLQSKLSKHADFTGGGTFNDAVHNAVDDVVSDQLDAAEDE